LAVYRRSRRYRFFLVLLVLTSVTVITLDYRGAGDGTLAAVRRGAQDAFAPIQSAADRLFRPVGNFFGGIVNYGDLKAENARLRQELDQARGDRILAEGAERERQALLELMRLDYAGAIPAVGARVVSSAPTNFQQTIVIDRGSDHRLAAGMPVVTGAGLVGRLVDVSRTRATVLLITDRSFNVGIRLTGSGEFGVAQGDGAGNDLTVDFVATTTPVTVGEAVVTSGLQDSAFPPEVPVGTVSRAETPPGALQQQISIDPSADLGRLDLVKVLLWRAPGAG
jgi:rod shape-determining protein MreC